MKVLLAYSGGLDTSYLVAWYTRERGAEVTTCAVDCGGWTAEEKAQLAERAHALGAVPSVWAIVWVVFPFIPGGLMDVVRHLSTACGVISVLAEIRVNRVRIGQRFVFKPFK